MKLTPILAALIGAAAAAPYTPPLSNDEGVYVVQFDHSGNPITRRLERDPLKPRSPGVTPVTAAAGAVEKRDFPADVRASCTNRDIPQDGTYQDVQDCLGAYLDNNKGNCFANDVIPHDAVLYCRSADTLLAVCFYHQDGVPGSSGEIATFNGMVDNTCGRWRSGYTYIPDWNKTYWRTTWGESICDNANTRPPFGSPSTYNDRRQVTADTKELHCAR